jgi:hypothetical protein
MVDPFQKPAPPKKQRNRAVFAALIAFDLLVLYAFSYGPAWWMFTRGWISPETARVVYAPVDWVYNHSPTGVQESMDAYVSLWEADRSRPPRGRRSRR